MKKGTVSIIAGLLLIAAALCVIAYNLWDERRAGQEAEKVLEQLLPEIDADPIPEEGRMQYVRAGGKSAESGEDYGDAELWPIGEDAMEYPDYVLNPNMEMPVKTIDGADYIGVISIPAIERELPVFSEWNYTNLKTAPCRYVGSAYLDNMVLCAHNYTIHFGTIKELSYGDRVIFTDADGNVFRYRVVEIVTLHPSEVEEMTTGDWDLTLFTCTVGGRTRVTVRCERETEKQIKLNG